MCRSPSGSMKGRHAAAEAVRQFEQAAHADVDGAGWLGVAIVWFSSRQKDWPRIHRSAR